MNRNISVERAKKHLLQELGIDLGDKLPLPRSVVVCEDADQGLNILVEPPGQWNVDSLSNLYLDYVVMQRWFWCIQFWERMLAGKMNRSLLDDQEQGPQYYETAFSAPMRDVSFMEPYERHRENIHIMERIGVRAYAYGLEAAHKIATDHKVAALTANLIQQCAGNDVFWKEGDLSLENDIEDECNWGTCYIFPFPFVVVFASDGLRSLPKVYSFSQLPPNSPTKTADIARVHSDTLALQQLYLLNTRNTHVRNLARKRLILRVLSGYRVLIRSQLPWSFINYRRQTLLVLDDERRKEFLFDQDPEKKLVPKEVAPLFAYPLVVEGRAFFESNQFRFIPGLSCYLELETTKSSSFQRAVHRVLKNWNPRFSFTSPRLKHIFENSSSTSKQQRTCCGKIQQTAEQEFREQIQERVSQTAQLRAKLSLEFSTRHSTLPYSFLSDVLFHPSISLEQFREKRVLFERLDEFYPWLKQAVRRQVRLEGMSPRQFVWFMFWFSFIVHHQPFVVQLAQASKPTKKGQLPSPTFVLGQLLSMEFSEEPLFEPIWSEAVYWEGLSDGELEEFSGDGKSTRYRARFFGLLDRFMAEHSSHEGWPLLRREFRALLSEYGEGAQGSERKANSAIEKLYDALEGNYGDTWARTKDIFLSDTKMGIYPELDVFEKLLQEEPKLRKVIRSFQTADRDEGVGRRRSSFTGVGDDVVQVEEEVVTDVKKRRETFTEDGSTIELADRQRTTRHSIDNTDTNEFNLRQALNLSFPVVSQKENNKIKDRNACHCDFLFYSYRN